MPNLIHIRRRVLGRIPTILAIAPVVLLLAGCGHGGGGY